MNPFEEDFTPFEEWIDYRLDEEHKYIFNVIRISEKKEPCEKLINFIRKKILLSYSDLDYYKFHCENLSDEQIADYIRNYVIPSDKNKTNKINQFGDWGEILSSIIVESYENHEIPGSKLKWKFNKDRSVFCTDIFAHNKGNEIVDLYYYEVKERKNPNKKENGQFITINAHNSLLKDVESPTEAIANYFERLFFFKKDLPRAKKYREIVNKPEKFKDHRTYELIFIVEKLNYIEDILDALNSMPPSLKPLIVTVFMINNLDILISNSWKKIEYDLVSILKEK